MQEAQTYINDRKLSRLEESKKATPPKKRLRKSLFSVIFFCLIFYFTYHAISGERGIITLFRLSKQVDKLQNELESLRVERLQIEHKVNLMRSDSLDLDLVDEQARKLLGYANKNEIVYFIDKENP